MIIIPEQIILNSIKSILKLIRTDYNTQTDKQQSYLYRILGTVNLERYGMYEQAKTVLVGKDDDPRFLDCQLFFNMARAAIPTIHITLPDETNAPGGMNIDENFQEQELGSSADTYRPVFSRRFASRYSLVITSDNTNEVVLIYHFLRAILIPLINHFNASGLEEVKLSGGDLNIDQRLIPPNIFVRAINLSFAYDVNVGDLFDKENISQLIFSQKIVNPDSGVVPATPFNEATVDKA